MDGGSGFACATALPAAPDAGGVAGWPAAGGAEEGVPAVAAPGGFAGEGGVWVAVAAVAGSLAGCGCGAELQAGRAGGPGPGCRRAARGIPIPGTRAPRGNRTR